ncbi:MAG TPA: RidA family protein [Candidatus Limiplasma pullicola]|nr:RidA family protein [Candidatus Limiplasma pullicola]
MDRIHQYIADGRVQEPTYAKKRGIVLLRWVDDLLYISGHGPEDQVSGEPIFKGRIGSDLSREEGYQAARECAKIILGVLKDTLGSLDFVSRFIKVFALVNCTEGFDDLEYVMDGFSDTIMAALEERGYHARTVMGTHNLPNGNIPCEFEVIVEVKRT